MPYHTIQVSRLFEVLTQQVLELDEAWLEDAVRTAIGPGAACGGSPPQAAADPTVRVHVRVGWPCWGRGVFTLPMEWEVRGNVAPWVRGNRPIEAAPGDVASHPTEERPVIPGRRCRGSRGSERNSIVARRTR
jgi:hypothetical protein